MPAEELHVVTGAFGYSGRYIARRLLGEGRRVRTLTNSPRRENPFGGKVEVRPLDFDNPAALMDALRGASVLYNTYWVRFNYTGFSHSAAVENTLKLFTAAQKAEVKRIVHVSITNPSENSPLEYFRGKAQLERSLAASGLSHAILRPTVLFGAEDILINNIAWILRRFPVFGVFGDGAYRLQPIYVDDFAALAVTQGRSAGNRVIDAVGPETFTYREVVRLIGKIIGKQRPIIPLPPQAGYLVGSLLGKIVGDVVITREEIEGLMQGLLFTHSPPAGSTTLTAWAKEHASSLGIHYASELARRRNRQSQYEQL
jgi:uncharacterized protein YbjT (DUF2867 family)